METSTRRREEFDYSGVQPATCEPLAHPLRVRILEVAIGREISPIQFVNEGLAPQGMTFKDKKTELSRISYHFRELEKEGCVQVVRTIPKRGAVEHIYRGIQAVDFSDDEFAALPAEQRKALSRLGFQGLIAMVDGAMREGTFDARSDRWLAWRPLKLDERGWKEMMTSLAAVYTEIEQIRKDSEARLSEGTEEPIHTTFAALGFESPAPPATPVD